MLDILYIVNVIYCCYWDSGKWGEEPQMLGIDQDRMQRVAQEAFDRVSGNHRWETAIAKAKAELESNPYIHFDGRSLLILSSSNEIYSANGSCQCKAYLNHQPCWHRAAARLIQRYNETSH